LCAIFGDFLLIYSSLSGGEYQGYIGFGILLEHIYPMTRFGEGAGTIKHISFDILNFLITFVIIFIIVFVIVLIIKTIKKKKEK